MWFHRRVLAERAVTTQLVCAEFPITGPQTRIYSSAPVPGRGCVHIPTPSLAPDYIHCTPNYRVQPLADAEEECDVGGWMKLSQTAVPLKAQE